MKPENAVEETGYSPVGSYEMDLSAPLHKSQADVSDDGVVTYERPKVDSTSVVLGPGQHLCNTSFDPLLSEQTKLVDPIRVRELFHEFEGG